MIIHVFKDILLLLNICLISFNPYFKENNLNHLSNLQILFGFTIILNNLSLLSIHYYLLR